MANTTTSKTRKKTVKKVPIVHVCVAKFDTVSPFSVVRDCVVSDYSQITSRDYSPRGGTPLLDAVARFLSHIDTLTNDDEVIVGLLLDESGSMGNNQRSVIDGVNEFVGGMSDVKSVDPKSSGKAILVIFTDGYENSSSEVTRTQVQEMLRDREKRGFTVIYMGANQDAWAESLTLGLSGRVTGQSANYMATARGTTSALRTASCDIQNYLTDTVAYASAKADKTQWNVEEDGEVK